MHSHDKHFIFTKVLQDFAKSTSPWVFLLIEEAGEISIK